MFLIQERDKIDGFFAGCRGFLSDRQRSLLENKIYAFILLFAATLGVLTQSLRRKIQKENHLYA